MRDDGFRLGHCRPSLLDDRGSDAPGTCSALLPIRLVAMWSTNCSANKLGMDSPSAVLLASLLTLITVSCSAPTDAINSGTSRCQACSQGTALNIDNRRASGFCGLMGSGTSSSGEGSYQCEGDGECRKICVSCTAVTAPSLSGDRLSCVDPSLGDCGTNRCQLGQQCIDGNCVAPPPNNGASGGAGSGGGGGSGSGPVGVFGASTFGTSVFGP